MIGNGFTSDVFIEFLNKMKEDMKNGNSLRNTENK